MQTLNTDQTSHTSTNTSTHGADDLVVLARQSSAAYIQSARHGLKSSSMRQAQGHMQVAYLRKLDDVPAAAKPLYDLDLSFHTLLASERQQDRVDATKGVIVSALCVLGKLMKRDPLSMLPGIDDMVKKHDEQQRTIEALNAKLSDMEDQLNESRARNNELQAQVGQPAVLADTVVVDVILEKLRPIHEATRLLGDDVELCDTGKLEENHRDQIIGTLRFVNEHLLVLIDPSEASEADDRTVLAPTASAVSV